MSRMITITENAFDNLPESAQEQLIKEDNMNTHIKPTFIHCCGYNLVPETKSDEKLMGKAVEPKDLSKALLIRLCDMLMQDRDEAEQAKPKQLSHHEQVVMFWRDIGWNKHLNDGQKRWALKRTQHVQLNQTAERRMAVLTARRSAKRSGIGGPVN